MFLIYHPSSGTFIVRKEQDEATKKTSKSKLIQKWAFQATQLFLTHA